MLAHTPRGSRFDMRPSANSGWAVELKMPDTAMFGKIEGLATATYQSKRNRPE